MQVKSRNLSNGGLHVPFAEDGLYQSDPPPTFAAREAVALGDAPDPSASGQKKVAMKLHVNREHASVR